jgi:hypothetical protein
MRRRDSEADFPITIGRFGYLLAQAVAEPRLAMRFNHATRRWYLYDGPLLSWAKDAPLRPTLQPRPVQIRDRLTVTLRSSQLTNVMPSGCARSA